MKSFAFGAAALLLFGCASVPPPAMEPRLDGPAAGPAEAAAHHAAKMLGKPYRLGGASASTGFDCSGLVRYSYQQAGIAVPRNTEQQRAASRAVAAAQLRRGDLLFFDLDGRKNSHVAIYMGEGHFVHAPSTGKTVRADRLDAPFWKRRFSEARRFEL